MKLKMPSVPGAVKRSKPKQRPEAEPGGPLKTLAGAVSTRAKAPTIKLPATVRAPKLRTPSIVVPTVIQDLGRDMRDRRLILPAIALLAAIVAVPALLKADPTPAPAAQPPPAGLERQALAVQPAVLADQAGGVRDYRKRLETFKKHNPFAQRFKVKVKAKSGDSTATAGAAATSSSASVTGGDVATTPTAPAASSPAGDTGSGGSAAPAHAPAAAPAPSSPAPARAPVNRFFAWQADVAVGPIGDTHDRRNVRDFDILPSKLTPVFVFLGATNNGKQAAFSVSSDVDSSHGDGRCEGGGPINCAYVLLRKGQGRNFHYEPTGKTYRLRVTGITAHEIKHPEVEKTFDDRGQ